MNPLVYNQEGAMAHVEISAGKYGLGRVRWQEIVADDPLYHHQLQGMLIADTLVEKIMATIIQEDSMAKVCCESESAILLCSQ